MPTWCNLSLGNRKTVSYVKNNAVHRLIYQPRQGEKAHEYYRLEEADKELVGGDQHRG